MTENEWFKILEKNGFEVKKTDFGYNFRQQTPAGEDWNLDFNNLDEFQKYAENFNAEEEFNIFYEAKKNGFSGVPEIGTLWKDQLWKKDLLEKINKELKNDL